MSRTRNCRPRISYAERDRIIGVGEQLNGGEVSGLPEAFRLLTNYLDVLVDGVEECPDCAGELQEHREVHGYRQELPAGQWQCRECAQVVSIAEIIGSASPSEAELPALPDGSEGTDDSVSSDWTGTNPLEERQDTREAWRNQPTNQDTQPNW